MASRKDDSTVYNAGNNVICISESLPFTIGNAIVSFTILDDVGGICVFYQRTSLTLEQIRPLTNSLLEPKCKIRGSVPIPHVDEGSNDSGEGTLTFNFASAPVCNGNSISADETDGPSVALSDIPMMSQAPGVYSILHIAIKRRFLRRNISCHSNEYKSCGKYCHKRSHYHS